MALRSDNEFWHDPVVQHWAPFRWLVVFRSKTGGESLSWWYWSKRNTYDQITRWHERAPAA